MLIKLVCICKNAALRSAIGNPVLSLSVVYDVGWGANDNSHWLDRFIWGAQFEKGAFVTPYIVTAGATATRAAPVCTTTDLGWYNTAQGTFVARGIWAGTGAAATRFIQLDDATENNQISILATSSAGRGFITATSASQYDQSPAATTTASFGVALGVAASSRVYAAGVAGAASGAVTVPTGLTTLRFGSSSTAVTGGMWVQSASYYPTRLPDATLAAISA